MWFACSNPLHAFVDCSHDLEFAFTPGVHAALVYIHYVIMCCLLAAMPRYSTCLHALCSLLFWAPSCYNTGKIPYFLKSACKAAKLHGNILPDSRTLSRCEPLSHYIVLSSLGTCSRNSHFVIGPLNSAVYNCLT